MFTALLILFIIGIIVFGLVIHKTRSDILFVAGEIGTISCSLLAIGIGITLIVGICKISTVGRYDYTIAMYEEENKQLEDKIDIVVEEYLKHEGETYDKSIPADTLIVIYPELASNQIVSQYIEILNSNKAEIKQLKQEQINISVWKFLVYFGN